MLAQSYVPWQTMDKTFKPCVGLKMGTIFPELVSPYVPCYASKFLLILGYTTIYDKIGEKVQKKKVY